MPSMNQNQIESEPRRRGDPRQLLRVLDLFFNPVADDQAPSVEEAVAAMAPEEHTKLGLPPAALARLQPQAEEAGWSAQESGAVFPPPVDEPDATTTATALPLPTRAATRRALRLPSTATPAGMVTSGDDLGLSAYSSSPRCSRRWVRRRTRWHRRLRRHTRLRVAVDRDLARVDHHLRLPRRLPSGLLRRGLAPTPPPRPPGPVLLSLRRGAELAAPPTVKLPSASVGFCVNVVAQRGLFSVHRSSLYVNGVQFSSRTLKPELYDDGRCVVHGRLHPAALPRLRRRGPAQPIRHSLRARSAANSASTATSFVRIMIRDAIFRLRASGFAFVALAVPLKFAEMEELSNLRPDGVRLDDEAIFTGGDHGYVSAVRHFHIIAWHRFTRHRPVLRLRAGTVLPTLAGEEQKLVITHDAGSAPTSSDQLHTREGARCGDQFGGHRPRHVRPVPSPPPRRFGGRSLHHPDELHLWRQEGHLATVRLCLHKDYLCNDPGWSGYGEGK